MERVLKIRTEVCFGTQLECAPQTFSLFKTDQGTYFFRHWRLCSDGKRRSSKFAVNKKDIELLLNQLLRLQIPAIPSQELGCDGGFTELEWGDNRGRAHYRWWSVPPCGWEQLDFIAQQMLGLLPVFDDRAE